jgi:hypothetical protein
VNKVVLALGNYLNGGTFRGGAFGFKLESLSRVCHNVTATAPERGIDLAQLYGVQHVCVVDRGSKYSSWPNFAALSG